MTVEKNRKAWHAIRNSIRLTADRALHFSIHEAMEILHGPDHDCPAAARALEPKIREFLNSDDKVPFTDTTKSALADLVLPVLSATDQKLEIPDTF